MSAFEKHSLPNSQAQITPALLMPILQSAGVLQRATITTITIEPLAAMASFNAQLVRLHLTYDQNVRERNGDRVRIATLADFCGTRWQVNAIMIPVPWGKAFMMPVARVMSLYRRHTGTKALNVCEAPSALDVTASRKGNKVFLHVVNTNRLNSVSTEIQLRDWSIRSARSFEITAPPELEIMHHNADALSPVEKVIPGNMKWTFPAASVSAVEISDGRGRSTYGHARKQS